MAYSNKTVKEMITKFGNRITCIVWDNAFKLYIGYPDPKVSIKSVNDLIITTFGDTEVIGVKTTLMNGASYVTYHATELIQHIIVMDEGSEEYGPDPFTVI